MRFKIGALVLIVAEKAAQVIRPGRAVFVTGARCNLRGEALDRRFLCSRGEGQRARKESSSFRGALLCKQERDQIRVRVGVLRVDFDGEQEAHFGLVRMAESKLRD